MYADQNKSCEIQKRSGGSQSSSPGLARISALLRAYETNQMVFLIAPAKWNTFCRAALFLGSGNKITGVWRRLL